MIVLNLSDVSRTGDYRHGYIHHFNCDYRKMGSTVMPLELMEQIDLLIVLLDLMGAPWWIVV